MSRVLLFVLIHFYSGLLKYSLTFLNDKSKKIKKLCINKRIGIPDNGMDCTGKNVVWIHAASLGETKVICKFLTILEEKYADDVYVLTALTETGVTYLRRHKRPSVAAVGYLPLDTVSLMQKMVEHYSVSRVWLMETEIWPAMLWTCLKNEVPVGIINARMEEKSFRLYRRFLILLKPLFKHMDCVLVQDKKYASRFKRMGVRSEKIIVTGNIKSRIIIKPALVEQKNSFRHNMHIDPNSVVITAGCVHPGEADIIRQTIAILSEKGLPWKWVIVPRHLNRSAAILDELGADALHIKDIYCDKEWNVCLVEKMGILEDMYMIADAAVLGGTFIEVGGHNVWEAVQFALPVFFGSDFHTQQTSCERIIDAGVGFSVENSEKLAEGLMRVLRTKSSRFSSAISKFGETIKKETTILESYIP